MPRVPLPYLAVVGVLLGLFYLLALWMIVQPARFVFMLRLGRLSNVTPRPEEIRFVRFYALVVAVLVSVLLSGPAESLFGW